jgi:lysozyme
MLKLLTSVGSFFNRNPSIKSGATKAGGLTGLVLALAVSSISLYEGYAPVGHHDRIDPPGVNTVCFGHIENVKIGERHSKKECEVMLQGDLPKYDALVKKAIHVELPPHRHAAILSFTYNVGGGALKKSSVARYLNEGKVKQGCDALLLYNRSTGKVRAGLTKRRKSEREWCLRED